MKDIYIHIGMHKTGTTYLQTQVFPHWPDVYFVRYALLRNFASYPSEKKILISDELLSGSYRNSFLNKKSTWREERILCLHNLAKLFPEAHILICFRKHFDMILSLYKQYLQEGGAYEFNDFFSLEQDCLIKRNDLNYTEIIDCIKKEFKNSVFLYTYDEMEQLNNLIRDMSNFMKTTQFTITKTKRRINPGVRRFQAILLRTINKLSKTELNPTGIFPFYNRYFKILRIDPRTICQKHLRFISKKEISITDDIKQKIDEYYEQDWNNVIARVAENRAR